MKNTNYKKPHNKSFQRTAWASASLQTTPPLNSIVIFQEKQEHCYEKLVKDNYIPDGTVFIPINDSGKNL